MKSLTYYFCHKWFLWHILLRIYIYKCRHALLNTKYTALFNIKYQNLPNALRLSKNLESLGDRLSIVPELGPDMWYRLTASTTEILLILNSYLCEVVNTNAALSFLAPKNYEASRHIALPPPTVLLRRHRLLALRRTNRTDRSLQCSVSDNICTLLIWGGKGWGMYVESEGQSVARIVQK